MLFDLDDHEVKIIRRYARFMVKLGCTFIDTRLALRMLLEETETELEVMERDLAAEDLKNRGNKNG